MVSRLSLQTELETLLGNRNVYFQPPESVKMNYPAIRYSLSRIDRLPADNTAYQLFKAYDVTLIHPDPDNTVKDELAAFPMCRFDRHYKADNLNHYVFTLYY